MCSLPLASVAQADKSRVRQRCAGDLADGLFSAPRSPASHRFHPPRHKRWEPWALTPALAVPAGRTPVHLGPRFPPLCEAGMCGDQCSEGFTSWNQFSSSAAYKSPASSLNTAHGCSAVGHALGDVWAGSGTAGARPLTFPAILPAVPCAPLAVF